MKNDVIVEVNKQKIADLKEYQAVVPKIKAGQNILLLVYRSGSTLYITLLSK